MNQTEAQQFLADRGPWNIRIKDRRLVNETGFVFENEAGDVLTVDIFIDTPFVGLPGMIVRDFTLGVRV